MKQIEPLDLLLFPLPFRSLPSRQKPSSIKTPGLPNGHCYHQQGQNPKDWGPARFLSFRWCLGLKLVLPLVEKKGWYQLTESGFSKWPGLAWQSTAKESSMFWMSLTHTVGALVSPWHASVCIKHGAGILWSSILKTCQTNIPKNTKGSAYNQTLKNDLVVTLSLSSWHEVSAVSWSKGQGFVGGIFWYLFKLKDAWRLSEPSVRVPER